MHDEPGDDKLGGQGCQGQVKALNTQGRQAHNNPHQARHQCTNRSGQPEVPPRMDHQQRHGIGTHGHEAGLAQGNQSGHAGQQVDPLQGDHGDGNQVDGI